MTFLIFRLARAVLARLQQPCERYCGQKGREQESRGPKSSPAPICAWNSTNSVQQFFTPTRIKQHLTRSALPRLLTCLRAEQWNKNASSFFFDQSHTASPKISCISVWLQCASVKSPNPDVIVVTPLSALAHWQFLRNVQDRDSEIINWC